MKKSKKKGSVFRLFLLGLIAVLAVLAISLAWLYYSGKSSLQQKDQQVPHLDMNQEETETGSESEEQAAEETQHVLTETKHDDPTVSYKDKNYRYRSNSINVLLIGVDSQGAGEDTSIQGAGNGQADLIILANLNLDDMKLSLIPVNRDTMTKISVMDASGNFVRNETTQIALAYAYGNDDMQSAKLTERAVSNLFYGIPIHGFYEMNMSGITIINNAIGGVDVVLKEDYVKEWGDRFVKGATVHLEGKMAETYVRKRYGKGDGGNASRMERQKSYLMAMIKKILKETMKDPQLPLKLKEDIKDYSTSDIEMKEFSYLITKAVQCGFSEDSIIKIEGDSIKGDVYQEFYVDENKLYDLMINVFYEEVKE